MSQLITKIEPADKNGAVIGAAITNIPEPSGYKWSKADISGQDAGRTISGDAVKLLQGKTRTLDITWNQRDFATIATAFQALDIEYAWITYLDALTGTHQRKHFYIGDMEADLYSYADGHRRWTTASLRCIQAITDKV